MSRPLGSVQRAVLAAVREHGDPNHGVMTDYAAWSRREGVAHDLLQRGWLGLHAHTNPAVTSGRLRQWYLTPTGRQVLETRV